jgi:hypothetical protein
MNSSPIALRLASGSVMPSRRAKNRSPASTWISSMPMLRRNVSTTWSLSPLRISPVSTYTHVSWWPIAWWTSAAATDESTPPDRPQIARPSPTWARMRATCSSMTDAIVHDGARPARSWRNRRSTPIPYGECTTSGWNCTP